MAHVKPSVQTVVVYSLMVMASCIAAQGLPAHAVADVPAAATEVKPVAIAAGTTGSVSTAGVATNASDNWTALDLLTRFGNSLNATYMGCYQDLTSFTAPRRMSQRLGVWSTMTKEECARRAAAAGWTLFALTPYEDGSPYGRKFGITCWGSDDTSKAQAGGFVGGTSASLPAEQCTGDFQLQLYRLDGYSAPALTGEN
jgi:hypothetical protein